MAKITLAQMAKKVDEWSTIRDKRLALSKEVDLLKKKETELQEFLIDNISAADAKGVSGKLKRVWIDKEDMPIVEDETKLRAYVNRTKRFDLCQKLKPAAAAVKEMWAQGKKVPGVGKLQIKKLKFQTIK